MKISIITPTYNSEKVIEQCVSSLLNQTYTDFEHIIVDNVSSDSTVSTIQNVYKDHSKINKLKVICEKDNGIAEAFNKGINNSDGDIIGILNSDDYYYNKNVLDLVSEAFQDDEIIFVHGNIYFEDPLYGSNIRKPLLCPVTEAMPYNHPTIFFRKEVYKQHGFFDTGYKLAMDFEFICRLSKSIIDFNSRGYYLDGKPLVTMVAGGASWKNELESIEETRKALRKYDYWNFDAKKNYILRKLRTKIKSWLSVIKMENVVTWWRNRKWEK
ncbi:MAG: glycosyltransferase family 2 protein [Ignavibacteriaceae bacterium]